MIKGITTIRYAGGAKEFAALGDLLDSLGFERGEPWKSPRGQGQYFLAPVGKLEIVGGKERFPADLWVEVTDLDSVRGLLKDKKVTFIADISDSGWDSRVLGVEPVKGIKIAVWQKSKAPAGASAGSP